MGINFNFGVKRRALFVETLQTGGEKKSVIRMHASKWRGKEERYSYVIGSKSAILGEIGRQKEERYSYK